MQAIINSYTLFFFLIFGWLSFYKFTIFFLDGAEGVQVFIDEWRGVEEGKKNHKHSKKEFFVNCQFWLFREVKNIYKLKLFNEPKKFAAKSYSERWIQMVQRKWIFHAIYFFRVHFALRNEKGSVDLLSKKSTSNIKEKHKNIHETTLKCQLKLCDLRKCAEMMSQGL